MKHTKGPWYPVNYCGFIELQKGATYEFSSLLNEDDCEEAKANGILASCAPEMLDLLIAFTKAVPNDGTWNYQACMSKANELITKATGGN